MKYIKTFEDINTAEPEIGDYVIVYDQFTYTSNMIEWKEFMNTHVGRLIRKRDSDINNTKRLLYDVEYENIPENVKRIIFKYKFDPKTNKAVEKGFNIDEIVCWSKNKEELELKLAANKYNL
jgi:hypothetical protein